MSLVDPALIAERLATVRERIERAGGDVDEVRIMAVTKAFGPEVVVGAVEAGLDLLGESYVQEFVGKIRDLPADIAAKPKWHFVGRLQRNKVRLLPSEVEVIHSIDRRSLATEVGRRRPGQQIMVQVNISGEPQKGGCLIADTSDLVEFCVAADLQVVGLMGIGSVSAEEVLASQFRALRSLVDEIGLEECSIGMTDDLETAVRAGSTMVRVGSALFGPRPSR